MPRVLPTDFKTARHITSNLAVNLPVQRERSISRDQSSLITHWCSWKMADQNLAAPSLNV